MNRGAQAEELVAAYLRKNGYRIVLRNWHSRYGEIDVIAENGRYLVFAEVRCRAFGSLAEPLETVTRAKQRKILQTAQCFLQDHREFDDLQPRFDVASVIAAGEKLSFDDVNYIENAFGL